MDPIGRQTKKYPNTKAESKSKLGEENTWESNAPKDLGGGFNLRSGTRKADTPKEPTNKYQGKVEGKIKHIYGVNGKNDPD